MASQRLVKELEQKLEALTQRASGQVPSLLSRRLGSVSHFQLSKSVSAGQGR